MQESVWGLFDGDRSGEAAECRNPYGACSMEIEAKIDVGKTMHML